jgi:macrophage erythroblast attacher
MISRFKNLKRKVESLRSEEVSVHEQSKRRLEHLDELFKVEDLTTPAYTKWSGTRLDRMLVDYMVRQGFGESAKALAEERGISELVDIDVFLQCAKIAERLRGGSIQECLAWCNENKTTLKKLSVGASMAGRV